MFFDRERTRIKLHAKDYHIGNIERPELANWEAHEQRYVLLIRGAAQHGSEVPMESSHEARTGEIYTKGYLKKKNWLTLGITAAQISPRNHARKVDAGIVGSSVLATADQTSGYDDSSSSVEAVESKLGSSSWSVASPCYIYQLGAASST